MDAASSLNSGRDVMQSEDRIPFRLRLTFARQRLTRRLGAIAATAVWPVDFLFYRVTRRFFRAFEGFDFLEFVLVRLGIAIIWPLRSAGMLLAKCCQLAMFVVFWPIEFVLHKTLRKTLGFAELFDYAEFAVVRLAWYLMRPVRIFRRRKDEIATPVPAVVNEVITAPISVTRRAQFAALRGFVIVGERLNFDGLIVWLLWWTRALWYPFVALLNFVRSWFITRSFRQLAWGLPAAMFLLPMICLASHQAFWGNAASVESYRAAIRECDSHRDYDRFALYQRKLSQLGGDPSAPIYQAAMRVAATGNYDKAYEQMQRIAPEESPGYANAHVWIIQAAVDKRLDLSPDEARRVAKVHLNHVSSLGIKSDSLDVVRAWFLAQENKPDAAAQILKPLVDRNVSAAKSRLRLDILLKQMVEAHTDAAAVSEHLGRQRRSGAKLSSDDYQCWCIAEELGGNPLKLKAVLHDWLSAYPNDQDARQTLANWSINELNMALASSEQNPQELTEQIIAAFAAADVSQKLRTDMARLYHERASSPVLGDVFESLIHNQNLPPTLADVLGTAAALESDWPTAQTMLEQALNGNDHNPVAWNNLAFVMLKRGKDYDQALIASNSAIDSKPTNFHFRETRGQILVKLKRWKDAIPDLEFALNGIPESHDIHAALAEAYAAIGDKTLAKAHQQYSN